MMEILFRGKGEYTGIWDFGSLHIEYGETDRNGERKIEHRILGMRGECGYVIPETVGQFTGLTDKNGKKIFEGDIIKADNGKQSTVSVVCYGEFSPRMFYDLLENFVMPRPKEKIVGLFLKSTKNGEEMLLSNCSKIIEVIGNIHDNPELLEVTDNA